MNKSNITKTYILITPDDEEITVINMAQFCRDNGLNYNCMMQLRNPTRLLKSHKGYKLKPNDDVQSL